MSNKIVKINNADLSVKEFKGQRVVTFKDIDMLHERVEGTAGRNFRENRFNSDGSKRFIEGEDFFFIKPADVENNEIRRSEINNKGTYLITESGYLMLVKSLQDDLAWKVQRELVNNYFRVKEVVKELSPKEMLELQFNFTKEVEEKVEKIDTRVSAVEEYVENVEISVSDSKKLVRLVRRIVVPLLGGKKSNAYEVLSKKVFADLYKQIHREFGVDSICEIKKVDIELAKKAVTEYKLPKALKDEIDTLNNQIDFEEVI
ncbi:ORF6C domain-containing protein [Clostridium tertium]